MHLHVALIFAVECLALASGLSCRSLKRCVGSHSSCALTESVVECNGSEDFCYSVLLSNSPDDWLQHDGEIRIWKGCTSASAIYPPCPSHLTACFNSSCQRCCPTDNCNAIDPRLLLNLLPPPPTSPPVMSSMATTATPPPTTTLSDLTTSRGGEQQVCSLLSVSLSVLLSLHFGVDSILYNI